MSTSATAPRAPRTAIATVADAWRWCREHRVIALLALVAFVVVVPFLRGVDPNLPNLDHALESPSWAFPFGTDAYGRDELARVAVGGRRTLAASLLVIATAGAAGLTVGLLAALGGRLADIPIARLLDVLLSLPGTILALAIVGTFGRGFDTLLLALAIYYTAYFARFVRGFALEARDRPDVLTARLAGVGATRAAFLHVVPAVARRLLIVASLELGAVAVMIAGLSFLGLGLQPPTAEWGTMLSESRDSMTVAPWLLAAPGLAIVLTVVAANRFGEELHRRSGEGLG